MNTKKILSLLLAGAMTVGMLAACGNSTEPETAQSAPKAAATATEAKEADTNKYADTITLVW